MPKIIFKIDFKQDAQNWARIAKMKKHPFGRKKREVIDRIPKSLLKKMSRLSKNKAADLAYKHLQKNSKKFLTGLNAEKELLEFYFKYKGNDLFKVLTKITGKKIYTNKFYATFTLMTSAPYDPDYNWFMIIAKRSAPKQISNICHEILHLQFIYYYKNYCLKKGLTEEQFQDLKESLTFLLNEPIFKRFYLAPDQGYLLHQTLRKKLKKIWSKEKNFAKFLDKAIEVIKKNKRS